MEKTPRTFNARFEKETQFQIADLIASSYGRDKTEAVARAIAEAHQRVQAGAFEPVKRWGSGLAEIVPLQRQAAEIVEQVRGHQEASSVMPERDRGFRIQCRHCGEDGARGSTKYATICFGCKSGGHTLQPSECPVCTAGSAI